MAQPSSPSWPHTSAGHPFPHVDLHGPQAKIHVPVQDPLGAIAIGGFMRDQVRRQQGR